LRPLGIGPVIPANFCNSRRFMNAVSTKAADGRGKSQRAAGPSPDFSCWQNLGALRQVIVINGIAA
ncbi:MAG: hypothetical protein ACI9ZM_003404, partial [Paracoccaceae bacterium]